MRRTEKPRVRIPLWVGLVAAPFMVIVAPLILVAYLALVLAAAGADALESVLEAWRGKDKT